MQMKRRPSKSTVSKHATESQGIGNKPGSDGPGDEKVSTASRHKDVSLGRGKSEDRTRSRPLEDERNRLGTHYASQIGLLPRPPSLLPSRMAKIFSFNKDAPSLKPQPAPEYQHFDMTVQVVHFDMGKGRDIQRIRVRGAGVTKLYQRDFATRNEFMHWLKEWRGLDRKTLDEALDRALAAPNEKVRLPFGGDEEDLIADGFRLVAGEK